MSLSCVWSKFKEYIYKDLFCKSTIFNKIEFLMMCQEWFWCYMSWINNAAHFLFPGIPYKTTTRCFNFALWVKQVTCIMILVTFFSPLFFVFYASDLIIKPCHWHIDQPCKYTHVQGNKLCLVNGNTLVMSLSWTTPMWWVNGCSLAGKNYKRPANLGDRLSPGSSCSVSFTNRILCYLSSGLYVCATMPLQTLL